MKKNQKQKLCINKFQIAKINNPQLVIGGNFNNTGNDDDPPKTTPTVHDTVEI